MKKISFCCALVGTLVLGLAQTGYAAKAAAKKWERPYGMAGCGLGSTVMGRSGGQIFASTTNYTAYNQIFGITSGTSNCVDGPNTEVAKRMDNYIAANQVAIAGDIARGQGEALSALSQIMGCGNADALASSMQRNFREIFPSHTVQPNEVTDSIITVIKNQDDLTGACKNVV